MLVSAYLTGYTVITNVYHEFSLGFVLNKPRIVYTVKGYEKTIKCQELTIHATFLTLVKICLIHYFRSSHKWHFIHEIKEQMDIRVVKILYGCFFSNLRRFHTS